MLHPGYATKKKKKAPYLHANKVDLGQIISREIDIPKNNFYLHPKAGVYKAKS